MHQMLVPPPCGGLRFIHIGEVSSQWATPNLHALPDNVEHAHAVFPRLCSVPFSSMGRSAPESSSKLRLAAFMTTEEILPTSPRLSASFVLMLER